MISANKMGFKKNEEIQGDKLIVVPFMETEKLKNWACVFTEDAAE